MEIEPPNSPATNPSNKTNTIQQPNSLKQISIRQPPPGWLKFRNSITNKGNNNQMDNEQQTNGSLMDEIPISKIIIKGIKSISTKEFENM